MNCAATVAWEMWPKAYISLVSQIFVFRFTVCFRSVLFMSVSRLVFTACVQFMFPCVCLYSCHLCLVQFSSVVSYTLVYVGCSVPGPEILFCEVEFISK